MKIYTYAPFGYEGSLVQVEVDLRRGIPAVDIVGLADGSVNDSRLRIKAAFSNSGLDFPQERVLIGLSSADIKKCGGGFDLAMALGVYNAWIHETRRKQGSIFVMGELTLGGQIQQCRGIYTGCLEAKKSGITECVVPKPFVWLAEKAGLKAYGAQTLSEAAAAITQEEQI